MEGRALPAKMPTWISRPLMYCSSTHWPPNSRPFTRAAYSSFFVWAMKTPMEDPLATGFTTQGTGVVLVMSWVMVFVAGKQSALKNIPKSELGFICLSGLATGGSWLCYYRALQDGPASLVAPIDKLSILVTVLFSYVVFHEKLSRRSALGLVLLVGGTLVMLL